MGKPSLSRTAVLYAAMLLLTALVIEVLATVFVYHRYRVHISESIHYDGSTATGFLISRFMRRTRPDKKRVLIKSSPEPFRIPDSMHGYRIPKGNFDVVYEQDTPDGIRRFRHHVTILEDGSRYVGDPPYPTERDVYVFGDSFVFGEGVNDEQTFTYLLQAKFPYTRFHLFANPGHSMSNAYLNFQRLAPRIGPNDILILGYAFFFDVRHVAAPERMIQWGEPHSHKSLDPATFKHVRVRLASDSLLFDRIPLFCSFLGEYCKQQGPSQSYMDTVTARLVSGIATRTRAQVYLLNMQGELKKGLTSQLDPRIRFIHADEASFDYIHRDDINGFDLHPGPYWNHAVFSRIADTLKTIGVR
jgi:hypothetical protein